MDYQITVSKFYKYQYYSGKQIPQYRHFFSAKFNNIYQCKEVLEWLKTTLNEEDYKIDITKWETIGKKIENEEILSRN